MAGVFSPRSRYWPRSARRLAVSTRQAGPTPNWSTVSVQVGDHHGQWWPSSAAKKALAVRKIAFARRSSAFSRSSWRDPGRIPARGPWPLAGIDLGLLDPAAQRVAVDTQLLADPPARRRDAARLVRDVQDQADRPLPHLIRILPRCWHDSTLSWVRSLHQTRGDSRLLVGAGRSVTGASGCPGRAAAARTRSWLRRAAGGAELADLAGLAQQMFERSRPDHWDEDDDAGFDDRGVALDLTFAGAGRLTGDLTPGCAEALAAVLEALGKPAGPGGSAHRLPAAA